MTSRITTIAIANARKVVEPALDHGEEVEIELVEADVIPSMIRDGRIDHALCVLWPLLQLSRSVPTKWTIRGAQLPRRPVGMIGIPS